MSLNLYLLRHGETEASFNGGYCGRMDPDLTPIGHEMAKDFAQAYRDHPFEAIYVSPMLRTRMTARPLCELAGVDMQLRDGLRELDFGDWEGKSPDQVNREHPLDYVRWLADAGWNAPTGGERGIDVARRALAVLDEIQQEHTSGDVLVVSHKATIRILTCALLGIDIGGYRDRIGISVASLAVMEFHDNGPRLARLGDRSHLREELRHRPGS
ncbi:histidine phosphatase family protein [Methylotetracoccus oryzae]|uniref:histidine phosphatase family protein n=1 Tax=Methylotetracoccus oryzae TaxID=1919059 RepID=UPI00111ABACC|nr:histidine phosphatase family protein [Methylotetracoccus oryzae]